MKWTSVHVNMRKNSSAKARFQILLRLYGPEKFPGLSRNGPLKTFAGGTNVARKERPSLKHDLKRVWGAEAVCLSTNITQIRPKYSSGNSENGKYHKLSRTRKIQALHHHPVLFVTKNWTLFKENTEKNTKQSQNKNLFLNKFYKYLCILNISEKRSP